MQIAIIEFVSIHSKANWKPILNWWSSSFEYQMPNIHLKSGYWFSTSAHTDIDLLELQINYSRYPFQTMSRFQVKQFPSQIASENRRKRITIDYLRSEIASSIIYTTSYMKSIHRRTWYLVFGVYYQSYSLCHVHNFRFLFCDLNTYRRECE